MQKNIVKKKTLSEKELRQMFSRQDRLSPAAEASIRIERELHNMPKSPEIGPIIRQLVSVTIGMTNKIVLPHQIFYPTSDMLARKMLNHIVLSIITHGMIAEQLVVKNGVLDMQDNWDTQDMYDGDFSFFKIENNPYQTFIAPDFLPYLINVNPFNGLMSAYIDEMFDLRYMKQNMHSGNALSTQANTEVRTNIDLFKMALALTDGQEIENEFADIAQRSAINGQLTTVDIDQPGYEKFNKVQSFIKKTIFDNLMMRWGSTGDTFDINKGIIATNYRQINVSELPPGVEVKTSAPTTTGVVSYHQRSEHVRKLIIGEFSLATNIANVAKKIRYNTEVLMNHIYNDLMNPTIVGRAYLNDISKEYHALLELQRLRKQNSINNFDDAHDVKDENFPTIAAFFEMTVTELLLNEYDPLTLPDLIKIVAEWYGEMEVVVNDEIESYENAPERPSVKITWDAIDEKSAFNLEVEESTATHNVHDSRA